MIEKQPKGESKFLKAARTEIEHYASVFSTFNECAKSIVKTVRYEDVVKSKGKSKRRNYPTLWNNIRTTLPAFYARTPKPYAERRWKDSDFTGKLASQIAERAASYMLEVTPFSEVMKRCVFDLLAIARGVSWITYTPEIVTIESPQPESMEGPEASEAPESPEYETNEGESPAEQQAEPEEKLIGIKVQSTYIHWSDFGHSNARIWEDVKSVWKKVLLNKEDFIEKFGEKYVSKVQFKFTDEDVISLKKKSKEEQKEDLKACVIEYWHKPTKTVYWFDDEVKCILKQEEDPLQLEQFFPCPKPLYANLTSDSLIPVADYEYYRDQAKQLDEVETRIANITKALKVVGVRDGSITELENILKAPDGTLAAVKDMISLRQQGGINGSIEVLKIKEYAETLIQLYEAKDRLLADIDRIIGIPDIVRGTTNPNETAAAQQLKGNYNSLRAQERQGDVQEFVRDNIRLMVEVILENSTPEILWDMVGGEFLECTPDEFLQALQILKDDKLRTFRIEIETDSTISQESEADKQRQVEIFQILAQAAGGDPRIGAVALHQLLAVVRSSRASRSVEQEIQAIIDETKAQKEAEANAPKEDAPPPPDPAMEKINMEAQLRQLEMQATDQREREKMAIEREIRMYEAEVERLKNEQQANVESKRIAQEGQIAVIQAQINQKVEEYKALVSAQAEIRKQASSVPQVSSIPR